MQRRLGLSILLSVFIVGLCAYSDIRLFQNGSLPFASRQIDAHTAEVISVAGAPLPQGLQQGDIIDYAALSPTSRIAIGATLPLGRTYDIVVRRGGVLITVPVTTVRVDAPANTGLWYYRWIALCFYLLLGSITLLALWRGRDRAAAGLVLWGTAFLTGIAMNFVPQTGLAVAALLLMANAFYLLARAGFYLLVEVMVGDALTPKARTLWRAGFLLLLALGALQSLGGPIIFVLTGWAELQLPQYGLVMTASYLVPVVLLFMSYRHAEAGQRLRLRWMLWGSALLVVGIFFNNTQAFGFVSSAIAWSLSFALAMVCILYAVLRHRVVDVAVILDRTLVYGALTALIIGVLAAMNSLVEHAALGSNASLLLQVIVPLALGIVFQRLRGYAGRIVEQVFFRKRYLAEQALRAFIRRCGEITDSKRLFDAVIEALRTHVGTPGVAIYERKGAGYACLRQAGEPAHPDSVSLDDPAMVAARAERKPVDLAELASTLGTDGYLFPLIVGGHVLGVLICTNRPGEHYALDERRLIAKLVRQMGLAWQGILVRENQAFVRAVARGTLKHEAARKRALKLADTWSAS